MPIQTPEELMDNLMKTLAPDIEQVNALILNQLKSQSPLTEKIARHLIMSGGKRLRPILVIVSAYLGGVKEMSAVHKMAAAIEIMHTATLLHDDVVDKSAKRRNQATAHTLWGNEATILVGDFLLGRAFELMVEVGSLEALGILSRAASIISEGEVMQLNLKGSMDNQESEIIKVIAAKTASLFAVATETSAILAGLETKKRTAMWEFGFNLGLAFQLMDDALDYDGASQRFGKSAGTDFFEGKITMPLILCYNKSNGAERNFLTERILSSHLSKPSDLKKTCALMKKYDSLTRTRNYAIDYIQQANKPLAVFASEGSPWLKQLEVLADFCVARKF